MELYKIDFISYSEMILVLYLNAYMSMLICNENIITGMKVINIMYNYNISLLGQINGGYKYVIC